MLDHVSITVTDLARARAFYDAVLGALGVVVLEADDAWAGYGLRADAEHAERMYLSLIAAPMVSPDRRHWAFKARDRAAVDAFHAAGVAHGGTDDGAPGLRTEYHPTYYAAFLLDPDGNRVEAVCHTE